MKKAILRINKKDFLDWYFDEEIVSGLADEVYKGLKKKGEHKITLQSIWKGLGYIPLEHIKNKKVIDPLDILDCDEIEEPSKEYNVKFI